MNDPPLYAALAAIHLMEDRVPYNDQPTSVTESRYGADDDPQGPPSPPLEVEVAHGGFLAGRFTPPSPARVPDDALRACPMCGTGVHPDRILG